MKNLIVTSCIIVLLTGCMGGLLPEKRTEQASVKATEKIANEQNTTVSKVIEGRPTVPPPNVTVTGSSNSIVVNPPAAEEVSKYREEVKLASGSRQSADSAETAKSSFSVSLPLGVTIGLLAISLLGLLYVIKAWRKSSVAAEAAWQAGDRGLASVISNVEAHLATSVEPNTNALLASIRATAEKERGKVNAT